MRMLRRDTGHRGYGYSVPLYNQERIRSRKEISQEIIDTNRKIRQKRREERERKKEPLKKAPKQQQEETTTVSKKFLADLKKHMRRQKRRERYQLVVKPVHRLMREMKKESYRYWDMEHPQYKTVNMYRYGYFKNHILMRSPEGLTAGKAWQLLDKCWIGFKDAHSVGNLEAMRYYGRGIQKYLYLLEEVPIDFSNLGLKPYKETF